MVKHLNGKGNGNGNHKLSSLDKISIKITQWIGTPYSLILHSLFFIGIFILYKFGMSVDKILLILTTVVSLEAIYLSLFIQMTVNRNTESLEDVEEDIEDIQEEEDEDAEAHKVLLNIGKEIKHIQKDLQILKKKGLL